MEGEEGEGLRLSKRFSNKEGEVDYKTKSGTAWSHSYLNQKPWHPLSYPNQRRKWIAEQTHANRQRRAEEVAREYSQEQEFFRQTALVSKKEQEKLEIMKAVSFMYVRPPGYNAESAKAAEIVDERKMQDQNNPNVDGASTSMASESMPGRDQFAEEKKKPRPKDVFGRPLPTEEEFEVLKNAPRLETGVPGRVKPFGIEVRNVKCVRCGTFGHQSGDRECPLKDAIMPNELNRLKRDDPLTAILANTDPSEPLKWELKQKPGISPPRGGFKADDPNQQIVAEDIFDEYGGFLGGDNIPDLLTNFSVKPMEKSRKKNKHKRQQLSPNNEELEEDEFSSASEDGERRSKKRKHKKKKKKKKKNHSETSLSDVSEFDEHNETRNHKDSYSSKEHKKKKKRKKNHSETSSSDVLEFDEHNEKRNHKDSYSSKEHKKKKKNHSETSSSDVSEFNEHNEKTNHKDSYSSEEPDDGRHHSSTRNRRNHPYSFEDCDTDRYGRSDRSRHRHSLASKESNIDRRHKSRHKRSYYSSEDSDLDGQYRSGDKHKRSYSHKNSDTERQHSSGKQKHRREHSDSDQHHHHHSHRHHRH